ncbi:MAG TPA: hypothetical protein VJ943_02680 [Desulfotignum sp.]|nr:hypothetical protein [Desulfotignum sp.]
MVPSVGYPFDIAFRHFNKRFKQQTVLQEITCDADSSERFSIMGPSRADKTTLLNIMAGL